MPSFGRCLNFMHVYTDLVRRCPQYPQASITDVRKILFLSLVNFWGMKAFIGTIGMQAITPKNSVTCSCPTYLEYARSDWLFNISMGMPPRPGVYLLLGAPEDIFFPQFNFLSKSRMKCIWLRCQVLKSRGMNVVYKNRNAIVILFIAVLMTKVGRTDQKSLFDQNSFSVE